MKQYIDIVKKILDEGKIKKPVRKDLTTGKFVPVDGGVTTIACPNVLFSHDMKDGFPLLTTKKMAWRTIRVELEGFIKGITDKQWYKDRGCDIWNSWANPKDVEHELQFRLDNGWITDFSEKDTLSGARKVVQEEINDLGPIYGYQWRHFDKHYGEPSVLDHRDGIEANGVWQGTDQLENIVETLLTNPMDRRMVCSAWNPNQIHMMALPPCHWGWNVTVIGEELNLFWVQRSCDLMLGVPFNIASYGLLLKLLAHTAGLKAGNLSGMLVDCHIYENQLDAAQHQITIQTRSLPDIIFEDSVEIFNWTWEDVDLLNYKPHPKLDFGAVTI